MFWSWKEIPGIDVELGNGGKRSAYIVFGVKITPKLTFTTTTDTLCFKSGDGGNKRHL
jgi:hypothetical protein